MWPWRRLSVPITPADEAWLRARLLKRYRPIVSFIEFLTDNTDRDRFTGRCVESIYPDGTLLMLQRHDGQWSARLKRAGALHVGPFVRGPVHAASLVMRRRLGLPKPR